MASIGADFHESYNERNTFHLTARRLILKEVTGNEYFSLGGYSLTAARFNLSVNRRTATVACTVYAIRHGEWCKKRRL